MAYPHEGSSPSRSAENFAAPGIDSEVAALKTVLLHRPGAELKRLTPRNKDSLLFDGIPWVDRAQVEHDQFADTLRANNVEVLYIDVLLAEALEDPAARTSALEPIFGDARLGDTLRRVVTDHLQHLDAKELAKVLIAGLAHSELPRGDGLVHRLAEPGQFVVDPLPNLLFTRDSSFWLKGHASITRLAMPARARETSLVKTIYQHHPRFAGAPTLYEAHPESLEGGDVLLLAPGVVAIGVGERTTPAGAERLARRLFGLGLGHTALVVPIPQQRATMHLDTLATMVDRDTFVMRAGSSAELNAYIVRPVDADALNSHPDVTISGPTPFVDAAAAAMGLPKLRVIDTGLDPVTAEREQWDDGNNTLCVAPGVVIAYERNTETNAKLVAEGIQVISIPGSELGSGRGGPRCMSCPIERDPLI